LTENLLRKMANSKSDKKLEKQGNTKDIIIMLVILAVLTFLIFNLQAIKLNKLEKNKTSGEIISSFSKSTSVVSIGNATIVSMNVPAVNNESKGVSTNLVVEAMPGSGRVLVDIDNLLFWADTQQSIRIARIVAADISGVNVSNYDLIYNIYANASTIGGPSAGCALTIATIAALENKSLRNDVMITGSINHDGSIGPVESILAKAQVAKEANVSVLLVPLLQSREVIYEIKEHCEKFGTNDLCTSEQIPKRVNVSEETGVQVIEVGSIQEAMKYFFE